MGISGVQGEYFLHVKTLCVHNVIIDYLCFVKFSESNVHGCLSSSPSCVLFCCVMTCQGLRRFLFWALFIGFSELNNGHQGL